MSTSDMATEYVRRPISVDDYHRMDASGIFAPDERTELVDGEVIAVPRMGSRHGGTIGRINRLLTSRLNDRAIVRVQLPLLVDLRSEPEPEFVVVPFEARDWEDKHPNASDVLLLIEVSDASSWFDRNKKVPVYARAGVREVWLVDVAARTLLVFRAPRDGRYTQMLEFAAREEVTPVAFPGERFEVAEIVGRCPQDATTPRQGV